MLAATNITWSAGGALILDGASVQVDAGRLVGLIGPNGSGKTSLLRCAAALTAADSGEVMLDGADVRAMRRRAIARRLAFVEQDADTDVELEVRDVVLLGRTPHRRAFEPDTAEDLSLLAVALERTGLTGREHQSWHTLSGGERQRARIARALVQQPEVLLLDEPTNHLDVAHQLELLDLVRSLELATVAALHDLNLAAAFCDEIVVLAKGRVVATGPPPEVLTAELIDDVYDVEAIVGEHPVTGRPTIVFTPRTRGRGRQTAGGD
ncbi:MAG TPA: ABC transporter ATP-binding protein [Solirubrobacterales bacterium]|nr:ABC transporter ATP-binding protein [Solirubrobacterales bacterium]